MPNLLRSLSLFNRPIRKNRQFMHQSLAASQNAVAHRKGARLVTGDRLGFQVSTDKDEVTVVE